MGKRDIRCLCGCSSKKKPVDYAVSGTFFIVTAILLYLSHGAFAVGDNEPPELNIIGPANRSGDNDGKIYFNYIVTDTTSGINLCELYIDGKLKNSSSYIEEGLEQTFSWSTANCTKYEWYIRCIDDSPATNENISSTREFSILYTGNFDGNTTNFTNTDVYSIINLTLEKTEYGQIVYNETKDLSEGHDLYKHFDFHPNEVGVSHYHENEDLDSSGKITFYNLNRTYAPVILENGTICSFCTFVSYDSVTGTLIFNTTNMSLFSTTSNSDLVVWDGTNLDGLYAGKTRGPDEQVTFFANYTSTASGESITGAICTINFTAGGSAIMTWNATKQLYEYNRSFTTSGYKTFNVTCSKNEYEKLTRLEGTNIVYEVDHNTNGTTCANSTAGTGDLLGNAIGEPDGSYSTLKKVDEVYSTGYDTSGLIGHITTIETALTYYATTTSHKSEVYYDINGNNPTTYESLIPNGGTSATPLFHTYDHTASKEKWTFANTQDFRYRIFNNGTKGTEQTYIDAICLNITYKNYLPNIFAEYPYANRTLVKENEWVRFNKVNVTDDDDVDTVYFTINSANETTTKDGNSYSVDMQCTSSTTFNWTSVWANDTYNTGRWVNMSLDVVVDCDTDNPNAPSAINIQNFGQGAWLTGTEATLNCTEAGDVGPAGINTTSYIFQTNHTGPWKNITGCIYSGSENLCYWTLPGDTSQDIYIRCNVKDLADHTSAWSPTAGYAGIDNVAPTCDLTSPATGDNITTTPYTLSAASTDTASGVANVTFQYYDDTDGWTFACYDDTHPYTCGWTVDVGQEDTLDNRFRAICKDNVDRTNNSAQALSIIIDAINTPPTCTMTYPNQAGIYENAYIMLKADAQDTDPTDIVKNITFNYSSDSGETWNPLGINTTQNLEEYTYNWNTGALEGTEFLINCTAQDSRGGISHDTSDNTFTIDSSPPIITIDSPQNNSYLFAGTDILITITDIYGAPDSSWYSLNSGIENTSTISSGDIDTTGWSEGLKTIDYWANDTFSQLNHTMFSYTVDNTNPEVTGEHINASLVGTNKPLCLNVTVTDNYNIDYVKAEIDIPNQQENTNLTLLDTGTDCDTISGDDVYSATFTPTFDGTYNWTLTWAKDMAGNMNRTVTAILGTSSSQSFMNLTMVTPSSDLTINNTGTNNNYKQNCSVSCWDGGWDCDSIYLKIEYFYSSEWHIINKTTQNLTSDADTHACGNMVHGPDTCSYEFTVTSDGASGAGAWPVRCKAESANAPQETTPSIDITINDMPSTTFSDPATNLTWINAIFPIACTITDTEGVDHTDFYNSTDGSAWNTTPGCTGISGTSPECSFDTTSSACAEGATCYFKCTAYDTDGAHDTKARTARIDNTGPASTLITPVNQANITADSITVNATISDSGIGEISHAFFEYRINSSAQWNTACNDTDGDTDYNCTWDFTSSPDSLTYEVRVRANDTLGNLGDFNTHTNITIDRDAPKITLNIPPNNTLNISTTWHFSFTPSDNLRETMNCSIYLDNTCNKSNATSQNNTLTTLSISGISQGPHNWTIKCTDSIGQQNSSETRTFRIDYTTPTWSGQKQEIGTTQTDIFHRGDTSNLSSAWQDNYLLKETLLSTNETGEWQNTSWTQMTGNTNTSAFSWQNNSLSPGTVVGWKIYAKDTANLTNSTGIMTFTAWGWSKVASIIFTQNPVAPSSPTIIKCRVIDNFTSSAISGYTVSFYNSTSLIGANTTGSGGWAHMQYSDDTIGDEEITCNITGNITLHYNSSYENSKSSTLTVTSGLETAYCENVTYSGGFTQGSCTELELSDNSYFNWTNISDAAQENTYYARIKTQADAPEFVSDQINFTWVMTRHSDSTPNSKYRQPPAKGDLTYASLSDMYYEGDGLYGILQEDNKQLQNVGLNFYVPELDTEVTYTKLGIKLVARKFSGGTTEGLELHFWDFTTSSLVEPECLYFPATQTSYATYTCETTANVENLIDASGMVRIRFEDEEIDTINTHTWYIDYIDIRAYYDNPQTNNVYSYRLDWYNNTGNAWVNGTLIDANGSDTTHTLTISGANVTDAMTAGGNITGSLTFWQSGTPTQSATRFHEFNIDYFKVNVGYTLADVDSITLTNTDLAGESIDNTKITLKNMYEEEVSSATLTPSVASFTDNIAENYNYTLEVSAPLSSGDLNLVIKDLNITDNLQIDLQTIEYYSGAFPQDDITGQVFAYDYIGNTTPIIALDDSQLTYNYASLTIPKNNLNISKIVHCTDWNFQTRACSTWEINETTDYSMQENSTHIWFNVTSFDSFGGGSKVAIPNITNITVYNVTGQADTHTGGTLIPESGINTTIDFNVSADEKWSETWRAEFTVRNDGDANWNIVSADDVHHDGLNSSWQLNAVNDIWYIVGPATKTGGTWSEGKVTWDTSNGGLLQKGNTMTFYYVFNITPAESGVYHVYFLANDTSENAGSYDYSTYNVTALGLINSTLNTPPDNTIVPKDRNFTINATVWCWYGDCGIVNGTARYNATTQTPDTKIPVDSGNPLYVHNGPNPQSCGSMSKGGSCTLTWSVNSTGTLRDQHEIDVEFTSTYPTKNDTGDSTITIGKILLMTLGFTSIDFGVVSPPDTFPALNNTHQLYNITLDANSNDADGGLWIKGENLTGVGSYEVDVSNMHWNATTHAAYETLTDSYHQIQSSMSSGTNTTTYYWVDTPLSTMLGTYTGTIYFMVNDTY